MVGKSSSLRPGGLGELINNHCQDHGFITGYSHLFHRICYFYLSASFGFPGFQTVPFFCLEYIVLASRIPPRPAQGSRLGGLRLGGWIARWLGGFGGSVALGVLARWLGGLCWWPDESVRLS